jgi:hypothetical protein
MKMAVARREEVLKSSVATDAYPERKHTLDSLHLGVLHLLEIHARRAV